MVGKVRSSGLTDLFSRGIKSAMTKTIEIKPQKTMTEAFEAMKVRGQLYFKGAKPTSIKSMAYDLGKRWGRTYTTRKELDGVMVWREK